MKIQKSDGQLEEFRGENLERGLQRAGVDAKLIKETVEYVSRMIRPGTSTKLIHERTLHFLEQRDIPAAARYNLKHAMFQLGPSGYPFEHYVAQLMKAHGWSTEVGVHLQGRCVQHEVDVLAKKDAQIQAVEAKYHQRPGVRSDVKTALYVHARHEDLRATNPDIVGLLVTNTEFTIDARVYGECMGMHMMSWKYPAHGGLAEYIEEQDLYPISVFSQIPKHTLHSLMRDGVVLANQLCHMQPQIAHRHGLGQQQFSQLQTHAQALCPSHAPA